MKPWIREAIAVLLIIECDDKGCRCEDFHKMDPSEQEKYAAEVYAEFESLPDYERGEYLMRNWISPMMEEVFPGLKLWELHRGKTDAVDEAMMEKTLLEKDGVRTDN
jgi:hypothetical protein